MSDTNRPAVIQGAYADLKLVKTRKVVQVIIEVPMEQAQQVTDLLGWPKDGEGQWVAVALLNPGLADPAAAPGRGGSHPATTKAVLQLKDADFRRWLCRVPESQPDPGEEAAIAELYRELKISSRKELATNEAARNAFYALVDDYNRENENG